MTDWRHLFPATEDNSLEFFPPEVVDGEIVTRPPPNVFDEGAKIWKFSVLAQFIGRPQSFSNINRTLRLLWDKHGFVGAMVAGSNAYVIQFESNESRDWVLENGPWHVLNNPVILRKWEPNLERIDFAMNTLPIWVHLRNVPLELFHRQGLSYIASGLGISLYMDSITATKKRLAYAKVCVEIEAGVTIPDSISVTLQNGNKALVGVIVPWIPPSYLACKVFGHNDKICQKPIMKKAEKPMQVWVPKVATANIKVHVATCEAAGDAQPTVATDCTDIKLKSVATCADGEQGPGSASSSSKKTKFHITGSSNKYYALCDENMPVKEHVAPHVKKLTLVDGGISSTKKKHLITSSTNKYAALCDESDSMNEDTEDDYDDYEAPKEASAEVWKHLINNATFSPRKPRAASKGMDKILFDMKSKKAQLIAMGTKKISPSPLEPKRKKLIT